MRHLITAWIYLLWLAAAPAFADNPQDRSQNYDDANKKAQQGNQQLQPDMIQHLANAQKLMQQAQQEQQQNPGQANQDRQMGMLEQAKAQQLQNQMKANDQSAQANQNGQQMTQDNASPTGKQQTQTSQNPDSGTPFRESSQYSRASTTIANPSTSGGDSSNTGGTASNFPSDQIANLESAQVAFRPAINTDAPTPSVTNPSDPQGGTQPADLSLVTLSTPKNDSDSTSSTATGPGSMSVDPASPPSMGSAQTRLLAAAPSNSGTDDQQADFWKTARDASADEAPAAARLATNSSTASDLTPDLASSRMKGKAAVDDTPGKKLSDSAFWKRVGSEPKECLVTGRRTDATIRRHDRCLRDARRKIERRWRQQRAHSVAANAKSMRTPTSAPLTARATGRP